MLGYVEKLTRTPGQVNQDDVISLRKAGFDDRQVLDIVMICSTFNFMTRLADGTGIRADEKTHALKAQKDAAIETAEPARGEGSTRDQG